MRARRNKSTTSSRFETGEARPASPPDLGDHPANEPWHERTLLFWRELWSSPMAAEYLLADRDGLVALTVLVDRFWKDPHPTLAAEIRLQRQCFGLTPIDRRRLQWEVVRVEEAERKKRPSTPARSDVDPRSVLRAI